MNLPITNIENFEIVKIYDNRWLSIINNKIYECICPMKHDDDGNDYVNIIVEHCIMHKRPNRNDVIPEGIRISYFNSTFKLSENKMPFRIIK